MRIWLQNFVSIQPRTSLEKSDVSWPMVKSPACRSLPAPRRSRSCARRALCRGSLGCDLPDDVYRSSEGSFSAGSTATIATKYSFFQVFRDLQNCLAIFSKILQLQQMFAKNQRFSQKSALFLQKSGNNSKFRKIFQNFAIF